MQTYRAIAEGLRAPGVCHKIIITVYELRYTSSLHVGILTFCVRILSWQNYVQVHLYL